MPFDGSGNYSRTDGTYTGSTVFQSEKAAGINITASRLDTEAQDMANAITNTICKDGQTTPTANLPMGGFKHTNVADSSARTDYAKLSQVQDGTYIWGGTSAGSANVQTITQTPAITAYVTGSVYLFLSGFTNTGSTTININGVGAVTIKDLAGNALVGGEIQNNTLVQLQYNGTNMILLSRSPGFVSWTPSLSASGAMTISSPVVNYAKFRPDGKQIFARTQCTFTTGGTPDTQVIFTLPVTTVSENFTGSAICYDGSTTYAGYIQAISTTQFAALFYDRRVWSSGASRNFIAHFWYERA
jgi:hypothetical protein